MSERMIVKECKAVVSSGDRRFVALWEENYALAGHLGGGFVEIDPLEVTSLNWTCTEGKSVLFPEFDYIGPFEYVNSEDFAAWYGAKKIAIGLGKYDVLSEEVAKGFVPIQERVAKAEADETAQAEALRIARNGGMQ